MTYQTLIKFTIVFALSVIILGAYTRLVDAGLGCPDWPGCYGQIFVPSSEEEVIEKHYLEQRPLETGKGWAEMIHRYFAGTLGILIFIITLGAWRRRARNSSEPIWLPTTILAVVIFQAILGMWTVTLLLKPVVVMGHLLGGFTTLALLLLLSLRVSESSRSLVPNGFVGAARKIRPWGLRGWGLLGLVILIFQIALGGWTSTNYAALSCPDFPTCQGLWSPETDFSEAFVMWRGLGINYEFGILEHPARVAIHLTHRIGAIVTFLYLALFLFSLIGRGYLLSQAAIVAGIILIIQVGLGVSNIVFQLPLFIAVAHNAVAALLLLSLVYLNFILWRQQQ